MTMRDRDGAIVPRSEEYRLTIQSRFADLERFLRDQAKQRDAIRAQRAELNKKRATGDYSEEYFNREEAKIEAAARSNSQAAIEKSYELIGKLTDTAAARYSEGVDLADPQLANALQLLTLTAGKLDAGEVKKIVDAFTGDPAALRALRAVFENQNIAIGVNEVDKRLWEPAFAQVALQENAATTFQQNASLNAFASTIGRLALKEGVIFPSDGGLIDEAGYHEAVWKAAGLPAQS